MPSAESIVPEREALAAACRTAAAAGLAPLASGNASLRVPGGVLITASGARFDAMEPDQLVLVDLEGRAVAGQDAGATSSAPSSETPLHLQVYARRPDVNAIVHTHGAHAVALSTVRSSVPALHYYLADLGGPPPVAPYRPYGSLDLATVTAETLGGGHGVVMAHHGGLTVAADLDRAVDRAVLLEWLCQVSLLALSAGTPAELDDEQVEQAVARVARRSAGAEAQR